MKIKNKKILKNGTIGAYVYYPKEKKWKWRFIGRQKKKGGQFDIKQFMFHKGYMELSCKDIFNLLLAYLNKNDYPHILNNIHFKNNKLIPCLHEWRSNVLQNGIRAGQRVWCKMRLENGIRRYVSGIIAEDWTPLQWNIGDGYHGNYQVGSPNPSVNVNLTENEIRLDSDSEDDNDSEDDTEEATITTSRFTLIPNLFAYNKDYANELQTKYCERYESELFGDTEWYKNPDVSEKNQRYLLESMLRNSH